MHEGAVTSMKLGKLMRHSTANKWIDRTYPRSPMRDMISAKIGGNHLKEKQEQSV